MVWEGDNSSREYAHLNIPFPIEKEHLQSIKRDVCAASKSICLAQDRAAQVGLECGTLEKETAALVHEIQGLREELEETRRKTEEEYKLVRECREKMDRHRSRTDAAEQACPIQQELEGLRMAIDDLKDRSKCTKTAVQNTPQGCPRPQASQAFIGDYMKKADHFSLR